MHNGALMTAWQNTASGLTEMADLLTDAGMMLHFVETAGAAFRINNTFLNTIIAQRDASKGARVAISEIIQPFRQVLHTMLEGHIKQINLAFGLSLMLSNMFIDAGREQPEDELEFVRSAWVKVAAGASRLRRGLGHGGALSRKLLLEAIAPEGRDALLTYFPVPHEACGLPMGRGFLWHTDDAGRLLILICNQSASITL